MKKEEIASTANAGTVAKEREASTASAGADKKQENAASNAQSKEGRPERKSLLEIARESKNEEAIKLADAIEEAKKKRRELVESKKKESKTLHYKMFELQTVNALIDMGKLGDYKEKSALVRKLMRQKRGLEFRISTESFSLNDEKELIRKIREVDKQLNEALRTVKLYRKKELVTKDIEDYTKKVNDAKASIAAINDEITNMYDKLKKMLNLHEQRKQKPQRQQPKRQAPLAPSINLESIAVIKKK